MLTGRFCCLMAFVTLAIATPLDTLTLANSLDKRQVAACPVIPPLLGANLEVIKNAIRMATLRVNPMVSPQADNAAKVAWAWGIASQLKAVGQQFQILRANWPMNGARNSGNGLSQARYVSTMAKEHKELDDSLIVLSKLLQSAKRLYPQGLDIAINDSMVIAETNMLFLGQQLIAMCSNMLTIAPGSYRG